MCSVVACGGGGGGGTEVLPRTVTLLANSQITPWASGSLGFRVAPSLAEWESMVCQIDQGPEVECATGTATGRMNYEALPRGHHQLTVKIGKAGNRVAATAAWQIVSPDVVVYGATPGGVTAAISAARAGRTVVLIEQSPWIGGMMTGGLAKTDVGGSKGEPLGGITREFFERTRAREVALGACTDEYPCPIFHDFEPRVAAEIFRAMLAEQPRVSLQTSLPVTGLNRQGVRIASVTTARGEIAGQVFVDASYEGDLMALAGVSHTTIREARLDPAGDDVDPALVEDDAGVGSFVPPFGFAVDPFIVPGVPGSGLLPFVERPPQVWPVEGSADDRLMAYNYRLCVTDDPGNRVPFSRPDDYNAILYEASARVAVATATDGKTPLDELYFNPARTVRSADPTYYKHDLNGGSAFSTDMSALGWNQAYVSADASVRASIAAAYRSYIAGLLYFWQTDPRFGALNAKVARFGLCKDEFTDNDHWPYRLYTRETRRMVGEYVMNENDLMKNGRRPAIGDSIGMGAYSVDSHARRITWMHRSIGNGPARAMIVTEGFRIVRLPGYAPYPVSYRSLLPRRVEATNLLNPVTLSATSVAYASLRMEPTFMVLGQAAGTAAALALETGADVHDLDTRALQARLERDGQILH